MFDICQVLDSLSDFFDLFISEFKTKLFDSRLDSVPALCMEKLALSNKLVNAQKILRTVNLEPI